VLPFVTADVVKAHVAALLAPKRGGGGADEPAA
jgi:hypothetical protein